MKLFHPRLASYWRKEKKVHLCRCLLYTSDAADERSSVDLGGRRIIKKKKSSSTEASIHKHNRHNAKSLVYKHRRYNADLTKYKEQA